MEQPNSQRTYGTAFWSNESTASVPATYSNHRGGMFTYLFEFKYETNYYIYIFCLKKLN